MPFFNVIEHTQLWLQHLLDFCFLTCFFQLTAASRNDGQGKGGEHMISKRSAPDESGGQSGADDHFLSNLSIHSMYIGI